MSSGLDRVDLAILAGAALVAGVGVAFYPYGSTGDTPCGSPILARFEFGGRFGCGIAYQASLFAVGVLVVLSLIFVGLAVIANSASWPGHLAVAAMVAGAVVLFVYGFIGQPRDDHILDSADARNWEQAQRLTVACATGLLLCAVLTYVFQHTRRP